MLYVYRRRSAAWPEGAAHCTLLGTRTSHGRAVRTAHRGTAGEDAKLMQQLQKGPLAEWVGVLLTELAAPLRLTLHI